MNCGDRLRSWDYDVGITEEDYDVGTYRLGASDVDSMCRRFPLRTDVYSKTAVIPLYLFFVDASAGGLTRHPSLNG